MSKVLSTLLGIAGLAPVARPPSARSKAPPRVARPTASAGVRPRVGGESIEIQEVARKRRPPEPAVARTTRAKAPPPVSRPPARSRKAAVPAPRPSRPVGGFKMAAIVLACVTGATWLGTQVQGYAAQSRETPRNVYEMRPISTTFTF